jgi:endonuclease/exonuclease/phosphatase (EEP) superfamily protein YafD
MSFAKSRKCREFSRSPQLPVAILLALTAGCAAPQAPRSPSGPHFKVMTFNVNWGAPGPHLSLEAILREAPDILCLQETTPAWEAFLRPRLEARYPHAMFRHHAGAGGLAVFSRWPLEEVDYIPSPGGWFPGWLITAETPLGPVRLLNIHLQPPVNDAGRFTAAAYLRSSRSARLEEIQAFVEKLDATPALILGDFNEGDGGGSIAWLEKRGFRSALAPFDARGDTWRWRTSFYVTLSARLDHILHSAALDCLEARIVRSGASDHFPVAGVFELRLAPDA